MDLLDPFWSEGSAEGWLKSADGNENSSSGVKVRPDCFDTCEMLSRETDKNSHQQPAPLPRKKKNSGNDNSLFNRKKPRLGPEGKAW